MKKNKRALQLAAAQATAVFVAVLASYLVIETTLSIDGIVKELPRADFGFYAMVYAPVYIGALLSTAAWAVAYQLLRKG